MIKYFENNVNAVKFEQVEPTLKTYDNEENVNPDVSASYVNTNGGIVVEIKSNRAPLILATSNGQPSNEVEKFVNQIKKYAKARKGWSTAVKDFCDVLLITHTLNAHDYSKLIEDDPTLKSLLANSLSTLVWEIIEARPANRLRLRYHQGAISDAQLLESFKAINGYDDDINSISSFQVQKKIRLKFDAIEVLLVLLVQTCIGLYDPMKALASTTQTLQEDVGIYFDRHHIFFTADYIIERLNSDDQAVRKYSANIDTRRIRDALTLLARMGILGKKKQFYTISIHKRHHDIPELVLRQYSKHLMENPS
jgi:hypothetical protein